MSKAPSSSNKTTKFNLPPISHGQQSAQQLSKSMTNFSITSAFNINKNLFKLNEQVFVLNKFNKVDSLDKVYTPYQTLSHMMNNIFSFEAQNRLDLINWNMFRSLIPLFVDIVTVFSDSFKHLSESTAQIENLNNVHTKKAFEQLNQNIKRILMCSNTIRIVHTLITNSRELRIKLQDLNGMEEFVKLLNNDSFVNQNEKHKCLESAVLIVYNLSLDYKKKCPLDYGHYLLKFNKVDDLTAYIRCKSVLNLFPNNESFEERIGTKVVLFLKLLKKSYSSPIKAEINSIFFIYSALKEVKYKAKLVRLIIQEDCFQIFLIKLSELSFVCSKFNYPNTNKLDTKLLPYFDTNQNINNAYRTVYYSYVFYQLLYLDSDYYK
jgi:hypothetical protein